MQSKKIEIVVKDRRYKELFNKRCIVEEEIETKTLRSKYLIDIDKNLLELIYKENLNLKSIKVIYKVICKNKVYYIPDYCIL